MGSLNDEKKIIHMKILEKYIVNTGIMLNITHTYGNIYRIDLDLLLYVYV